jgi:excisionase family DNA binding protein
MTITQRLRAVSGYLTPKQLAPIIGSHYQTVYAWAKEGTIPHTRVGSRLRFDPHTIADWLERQQIA